MNVKTVKYHTQRLSKKNIADVERLHTAVYGKVPPDNFFVKKYETGFTNIRYTGFIAYEDELPIAFYGVIPCFIRFDDRIVLAAQSADTMTHPDHRNKGLFTELALLTYQVCKSSGIDVVFGFPNQNSLPGFIHKLGWVNTETMDRFIIKTEASPMKRFLRKSKLFGRWYNGYRKRVLNGYLQKQHGIENSVIENGFAGVYRDHHFRKYKTYNTTPVIKIGDSLLWIKLGDVLLIGDMTVKPRDFESTMNELKNLAARLGIREINFHASPGTVLHKLFTAQYDAIKSFLVIFKDLAGDTPLNKVKFTSADIDTF